MCDLLKIFLKGELRCQTKQQHLKNYKLLLVTN